MLKRFLNYIDLTSFGVLEFCFALYPIISEYQYGPIPMEFLWILILDILALKRSFGIFRVKLLFLQFFVVISHEFILYLINGMDSTYFHNLLSIAVNLVSIVIIAPALRLDRLKGAINLIAIISCFGIFYHVASILSGNFVSPIPIPFLPAPNAETRLFQESIRPLSFFVEPGAFAGFMMIPLFLALDSKKWLLASFYVLSILLSTSTNGIIMSPILVGACLLFSKGNVFRKLIPLLFLVPLVYFFFNSPLFEAGINKIEDTDASENVRLSNGPNFVKKLPTEYVLLGMPVRSANEYIDKGYYGGDPRGGRDDFYMSDFWNIISVYGVFILLIHILVYVYVINKEKSIIPYMVILFIALFTTRRAYGCSYAIDMTFLLMWINNHGKSLKFIRL